MIRDHIGPKFGAAKSVSVTSSGLLKGMSNVLQEVSPFSSRSCPNQYLVVLDRLNLLLSLSDSELIDKSLYCSSGEVRRASCSGCSATANTKERSPRREQLSWIDVTRRLFNLETRWPFPARPGRP